ncbi:hypothetical protein TRIUR3_33643 [Triticum urartu]|uniref:Uncharacterized protein n=1 Tax=Triticum urartu TaxID=4572 RepID=M8AYE6_TRIUA|nr:hypothetical protein TRIUR3_33643 [Triticum urartu]
MASTFPTPTLSTPKLSLPPLGPSRRNAAAAAASWRHRGQICAPTGGDAPAAAATTEEEAKARKEQRKRCLRCGVLYLDEENSAAACAFHGHITGCGWACDSLRAVYHERPCPCIRLQQPMQNYRPEELPEARLRVDICVFVLQALCMKGFDAAWRKQVESFIQKGNVRIKTQKGLRQEDPMFFYPI